MPDYSEILIRVAQVQRSLTDSIKKFGPHKQDLKANARLIAAAPDLLEALRDFSAYVHAEQSATDGAVQYSNTQIHRLVFKARAAIAKAEGA